MEEYRNKYEHYWIIELSDNGIDEAKNYFNEFFKSGIKSFYIFNIYGWPNWRIGLRAIPY